MISDSEDFYSEETNVEFKNTKAYPEVKCPTFEEVNENYNKKIINNKFEFIKAEQEIKMLNSDDSLDLDDLFDNLISIEEDSCNCIVISKNNYSFDNEQMDGVFYNIDKIKKIKEHTNTILELIKAKNKDFKEVKQKINPFELVFDQNKYSRKSSIRLANVNSLFNIDMITVNHISNTSNIAIVGDDGGYNEYILEYSRKQKIDVELYNIYPLYSKFKTTSKVFNQVKQSFKLIPNQEQDNDNTSEKLDNSGEETKNKVFVFKSDLRQTTVASDDLSDEEKQTVEKKIDFIQNENEVISGELDKNEAPVDYLNSMYDFFIEKDLLSLYIAHKKNSFKVDVCDETKKFLFVNVINILKVLDTEGIFIIKLHETYSPLTISLIYIMYRLFNKISLFKPYSSHNITSSRYLHCSGFSNMANCAEFIEKLDKIFAYFINLEKDDKEIESLFNMKFLKKDDKFRNYIFEMNKDIDEKRINRLSEMISELNSSNRLIYHKVSLKNECFKLWNVELSESERNKLSEELLKERKSTYYNNSNKNENYGNNNNSNFDFNKRGNYKTKLDENYDKSTGHFLEMMNVIEKPKDGNYNKFRNNNYNSNHHSKYNDRDDNRDDNRHSNNYNEQVKETPRELPSCLLKHYNKKNKKNSNFKQEDYLKSESTGRDYADYYNDRDRNSRNQSREDNRDRNYNKNSDTPYNNYNKNSKNTDTRGKQIEDKYKIAMQEREAIDTKKVVDNNLFEELMKFKAKKE